MRRAFAFLIVALLAARPAARAASIEELGTLPGGQTFESVADGVSADGRVVVGTATHVTSIPEVGQIRDDEAFRSEDGTMTGLATLVPGHVRSLAFGVSDDGSVVVGVVYTGGATFDPRRGFRWDANGVTLLPDVPGGSDSSGAWGVSGDGSIVVGEGYAASPSGGTTPVQRALAWQAGSPLALPLATGRNAFAADVSADGGVIFGGESTSSGSRAARWKDGEIHLLPQPASGSFARLWGAAANGRIAVGQVDLASGTHPIRWLDASRFELLGRLPAWSFGARAIGASADGSVVVGTGTTASAREAFVWDAYHGVRRLADVLAEAGVDLAGWTLESATDVSDDGLTIVGAGVRSRPRGFVVRLDPVACSNGADDDGDGRIDAFADDGCLGPLDPEERPDCGDGLDNDGDGWTDFPDDAGCAGTSWLSERPACSNGVDDDGDGALDFGEDPQCGSEWGVSENPSGRCGLGAEIAVALGVLARRAGGQGPRSSRAPRLGRGQGGLAAPPLDSLSS